MEENIEDENLDYLELTEGMNGYPKNIHRCWDATILKDFSEIEIVADKYDLDIVLIHQKNGWSLWENKGIITEPIKISSSRFGDNYSEFEKDSFEDEEDFIDKEVVPYLKSITKFYKFDSFIEEKKELWEAIDSSDSGEIIIAYMGTYYSSYSKYALSFSEDTHNWKIALIEK